MAVNDTGNAPQSSIRRIINNMQDGMQKQSVPVPPNRTALQHQMSIKSGWLKKQGGIIKSWHNRWFTLKGDQLYYYTSEGESKPQGTIFLPGNRVIEHPFNVAEPDKFLFEIVPGENKSRMTTTHETYPLCTLSEEERKAWIQAIRKVMYAEKGGAIFGQSLADTMKYESRHSNRKVPIIVEMCVEYLLKHALDVEGIFRLPGRTSLVRTLREQFDCGEPQDFFLPEIDVHSVASLLKLYLRELPDSLIPVQFYEPVMKVIQRDLPLNPGQSLERLAKLLQNIPRHKYNLLQYLCHFLQEVSSHSDVNKMSQMNLATVFVNSIIRPEDDDPALLMGTSNGRTNVSYVLINQFDQLFKVEYTPQGGAVQVDTLLDLEGSTGSAQFKVDTSQPSGSKDSTDVLSSDLMDMDVGGLESSAILPTPLASLPAEQASEPSKSEVEEADGIRASNSSDHLYENLWEGNQIDNERVRSASQDSIDSGEASLDAASDLSSPTSASAVPTLPTRRAPPVPPKKPSETSPVLPSRPAPPPPVPHSESVDSIATDDSGLSNDDEDVAIEALVNTDVSQASADELRSHIGTLCHVLKHQRTTCKELQNRYRIEKDKHKKQMQALAKKLDEEKVARANAVEKIMKLQAELQAFYMTLGEPK